MNELVNFGLLNFVIIWLSISALVIATSWFAVKTIPRYWPDWWERHIVDLFPKKFDPDLF